MPTSYAPACEPLSEFADVLKNRTSRARGVAVSCTGVVIVRLEAASSYVIVFWEVQTIFYNGESIDARTGLYNFRARWYSASNGRFERLDPFAGNPNDPLSFNKYGFVHGDPANGVDPSGETAIFWLWLQNAGAAIVSYKYAIGAISGIAALSWLRSSYVLRDGRNQFPARGNDSYVHSNIHEVRITGAQKTAGEVFERMASFNSGDYVGSPAVPVGQVRGLNDKFAWEMTGLLEEFGQYDFQVRVDQYDRRRRFVSVVTLTGHPLSGFRFWEVEAASDQSKDFVIRTGAVEHNTGYQDALKDLLGGHTGVLKTWETLFINLKAFANPTSSDDSLLKGKWDDSFRDGFKTRVNWRHE